MFKELKEIFGEGNITMSVTFKGEMAYIAMVKKDKDATPFQIKGKIQELDKVFLDKVKEPFDAIKDLQTNSEEFIEKERARMKELAERESKASQVKTNTGDIDKKDNKTRQVSML